MMRWLLCKIVGHFWTYPDDCRDLSGRWCWMCGKREEVDRG